MIDIQEFPNNVSIFWNVTETYISSFAMSCQDHYFNLVKIEILIVNLIVIIDILSQIRLSYYR